MGPSDDGQLHRGGGGSPRRCMRGTPRPRGLGWGVSDAHRECRCSGWAGARGRGRWARNGGVVRRHLVPGGTPMTPDYDDTRTRPTHPSPTRALPPPPPSRSRSRSLADTRTIRLSPPGLIEQGTIELPTQTQHLRPAPPHCPTAPPNAKKTPPAPYPTPPPPAPPPCPGGRRGGRGGGMRGRGAGRGSGGGGGEVGRRGAGAWEGGMGLKHVAWR